MKATTRPMFVIALHPLRAPSLCLWAFLCASSGFGQGGLGPPGPPAPTMKSLAQIEPRTPITNLPVTLTLPGSYYLTGNLVMSAATNGIIVETNDVTIDLDGFVLDGNGAAFSGIHVPNVRSNLVVRNGAVKNWRGTAGIDAFNALNVRIERVHASGNGRGIQTGSGSLVTDCIASGNTSIGFYVHDNSVLMNSVARLNGSNGILTDNGCLVKGCTAAGNQFYGISVGVGATVVECSSQANQGDGIIANLHTSIIHCTSSQNASNGIAAVARVGIISCTAANNNGNGIDVGTGCTIKDTTVRVNLGAAGILAGDGCVISGCTSKLNGTGTNATHGIFAGSSSTVIDSAVSDNTGHGIAAGFGCTISRNTARANRLDGIQVGSSCGVSGNTCDFNGNGGDGAGIHATAQAARIEGNHCIANDRGIDVDGDRNVIFHNTSGFNTIDFEIVANNKVGPIVAAPNSPAISGSTGGSGLGTTDPWANVSF